MPNSYTTIDLAAGSVAENAVNQTVFGPFTFDYINTADLSFAVKVGDEWKPISVASVDTVNKKVTLSATPEDAVIALHTHEARVFRSTTLSPVVDFQSGSRISEADLDNAYRQGLFAAQEATEDAPGSASRTVQATDDIQDGAVNALKLATDAVETLKIKDLQVTAGKLAATLDLTGKTVTLPADTVTLASIPDGTVGFAKLATAAVIDDDTMASASATKLATSESIKAYVDGPGRILEQFLLPCDGIAYTARSGTYTPSAVTAGQDLTTTYGDITGSSITYTPPAGTKLIIYKFVMSPTAVGAGIGFYKVVLGGVDVTDSRQAIGEDAGYGNGRRAIEWSFAIGGTANAATGRLNAFSDWSSGLVIKLQGREYNGTADAAVHGTYYEDDGTEGNMFSRPLIGITAIA